MEKGAKFEDIAKSFAVKELPLSEVEITGEVPYDTIAPYREVALTHLSEHAEMAGFRPGKVPKDMVLKKVGEVAVLEEAVELFVKDFYSELVELKKLEVVGRPEIKITKLAPLNPLGRASGEAGLAENPVALTIRVALYPTVMLPSGWKEMGEKIVGDAPLPATDDEVDQTIEDIRKNRRAPSASVAVTEGALPELNDDFAMTVGAFKTVDELKAQIKKGIGEEKERKAKDARRGKIIDALLEKVAIAIPNIFVESELDKIMSQMKEDVERMGVKIEDYFKHVQKTEDQVRQEFRDQAGKRAKLQLTLNKIAQEEKIEPEKEAVDTEMKHALEHFKDANQTLLRIHIESVLRNEKVLKLLEGEK